MKSYRSFSFFAITVGVIFLNAIVYAQERPNIDDFGKKGSSEKNEVVNPEAIISFANLKNANSITLIFEFPYAEHIAGLSENGLRRVGCTYVTSDKKRISDMVEIIRDALMVNQKNNQDSSGNGVDVREAVIFEMQASRDEKFLFDEPYKNDEILSGLHNNKKISVNPLLVKSLYGWAAVGSDFSEKAVGEASGVSSGHPSSRAGSDVVAKSEACRSFVKKYLEE